MPNYAYVAKTPGGDQESGVLFGATSDGVVDELHRRGLVVLHVAEEAIARAAPKWWSRLNQPIFGGGVPTRDMALFTRQLSTLFEAGIPLVRGLKGLAKDESNRRLGKTVGRVAESMEQGNSLADALAEHPRIFNKLYVSMVRAGENAGTLDHILNDMAVYLERLDAIKTKVRSALAYPVFVFFFAVSVCLFLLLRIVPTFQDIYDQFDAVLPAPTRALLYVSQVLRDNALIALAILAAVVVALALFFRTRPGRYAKDSFMISVPLFGPIIRRATISRMNRTLSILLKSGLPVLDALELTKGATDNEVLERALDQVKSRVSRGEELTPAFRSTRRMPEVVLQLMATGEESGQLDSMLLKSSEFFDRQVEASVHGLASLIEPLLIIVVGIIVGIVVVTMFLPIFYLGDAIMRSEYG